MLRERALTQHSFIFQLVSVYFTNFPTKCLKLFCLNCKCFESAKFPGVGGINKKPDKMTGIVE